MVLFTGAFNSHVKVTTGNNGFKHTLYNFHSWAHPKVKGTVASEDCSQGSATAGAVAVKA